MALESLQKRYLHLKECFEKEAKREGNVYLPSIQPPIPVDFVFIGMEPSLGRWAKTQEEAKEKIEQGFKDFALSIEDFILHYCIRNYLCRSDNYYVTNLSKGAMHVEKANEQRNKRYERWYPLLVDELKVVSKDSTQLIAIGKSVQAFLEKNMDRNIHSILHYSPQAAKYRGKYIQGRESEFEEFSKNIEIENILDTAVAVIQECQMSEQLSCEILGRLWKRRLSVSQKRLIFDYKTKFEMLR